MIVEDGEILENTKGFRKMIGKLNYLTMTHLDITFSMSLVSQFLTQPRTTCWDVILHFLIYLKGALGSGIAYNDHDHCRIEGFINADWVGYPMNRRSTFGYCIFFGGNLVSWKSNKQNAVVRSSVESKYRAIAQATCELIQLQHLLGIGI